METAVELKVIGIVQGVYYRKSTQEKARELGLRGWVKNNPDGSVSIKTVGKTSDIQGFIQWCWQGPPRAKVENIFQNQINVSDIAESSFMIL